MSPIGILVLFSLIVLHVTLCNPCWPCTCRGLVLRCKGDLVNHVIVKAFLKSRITDIVLEETSMYTLPDFTMYHSLNYLELKGNMYIQCYMLDNIPSSIIVTHDMVCLTSENSYTTILDITSVDENVTSILERGNKSVNTTILNITSVDENVTIKNSYTTILDIIPVDTIIEGVNENITSIINSKVTIDGDTTMNTDPPITDVITKFYMYITKGHTSQTNAPAVSEGILNITIGNYTTFSSTPTTTELFTRIIEESTHVSSTQNTSSVDFIYDNTSYYHYMSVTYWICGVIVILLCMVLLIGSCMWIKHHFHFLRHNQNNPGKILTILYIYFNINIY